SPPTKSSPPSKGSARKHWQELQIQVTSGQAYPVNSTQFHIVNLNNVQNSEKLNNSSFFFPCAVARTVSNI
ncbi:hypothetical protein, partial [Lacimonas salitolerans]